MVAVEVAVEVVFDVVVSSVVAVVAQSLTSASVHSLGGRKLHTSSQHS